MKENFEQIGKGGNWSKRFNCASQEKRNNRLTGLEDRDEAIDEIVELTEREIKENKKQEFVRKLMSKWREKKNK